MRRSLALHRVATPTFPSPQDSDSAALEATSDPASMPSTPLTMTRSSDLEPAEGDGDRPGRQSRALTTVSSTATLCHLSEDEDGYLAPHKTRDSTMYPPTIMEQPVSTNNLDQRPALRRVSPPPIPSPDVIAYLDPASAGGGGPLKRITTQQRERAEAEARDRAMRTHQEAAGLSTSPHSRGGALPGTILGRLWPKSPGHSKQIALTPHVDEERYATRRAVVSPDWSTRTLIEDETSSSKESEQRIPEYSYPDGGYGWVVVICCMALAGCCMG